jgi:hypothetical protein
MKIRMEKWWNDTDKEKQKYWKKNNIQREWKKNE